jgi:DNA-damage-inducible protein J
MAQTVLSISMEEEVKKSLEDFCADVGMNVSVAVNLFAKTVIKEQRLPFEITAQKSSKLNATTTATLEDIEVGGGLRRFGNLKDLFAELKED